MPWQAQTAGLVTGQTCLMLDLSLGCMRETRLGADAQGEQQADLGRSTGQSPLSSCENSSMVVQPQGGSAAATG